MHTLPLIAAVQRPHRVLEVFGNERQDADKTSGGEFQNYIEKNGRVLMSVALEKASDDWKHRQLMGSATVAVDIGHAGELTAASRHRNMAADAQNTPTGEYNAMQAKNGRKLLGAELAKASLEWQSREHRTVADDIGRLGDSTSTSQHDIGRMDSNNTPGTEFSQYVERHKRQELSASLTEANDDWTARARERESAARSRFADIDLDGKGFIIMKDMAQAAPLLGVSPSDSEQLFRRIDVDGVGEVNLERFVRFFKNTTLAEGFGHAALGTSSSLMERTAEKGLKDGREVMSKANLEARIEWSRRQEACPNETQLSAAERAKNDLDRVKAKREVARQIEEATRLEAEAEEQKTLDEAAAKKDLILSEFTRRQKLMENEVSRPISAKDKAKNDLARVKAKKDLARQTEEASRLQAEAEAKKALEDAMASKDKIYARIKLNKDLARQKSETVRLESEADAIRKKAEKEAPEAMAAHAKIAAKEQRRSCLSDFVSCWRRKQLPDVGHVARDDGLDLSLAEAAVISTSPVDCMTDKQQIVKSHLQDQRRRVQQDQRVRIISTESRLNVARTSQGHLSLNHNRTIGDVRPRQNVAKRPQRPLSQDRAKKTSEKLIGSSI
jgi:hypothetical protein